MKRDGSLVFLGMGFVFLFWVEGSYLAYFFIWRSFFFGVAVKRSNFGNLPLKDLNRFFFGNVLE